MTKEDLEIEVMQMCGFNRTNGEIAFFNKGIEVGRTPLYEFSTMRVRHLLADYCKVEEYDNFHLIRTNKEVIDANQVKIVNLAISDEDTDKSRGEYEGVMYQIYKNKNVCDKCGATNYLPSYKSVIK